MTFMCLVRLFNQSNTPHIWCYFIFVRCVGQSLDFHLSNQFINSTKWQEGSRRGAATAVTAFPSPFSTPFVNEAGV